MSNTLTEKVKEVGISFSNDEDISRAYDLLILNGIPFDGTPLGIIAPEYVMKLFDDEKIKYETYEFGDMWDLDPKKAAEIRKYHRTNCRKNLQRLIETDSTFEKVRAKKT